MNGDITRSTFHPGHDFTSVRHQQGRVVPDADLNEQTDIELFDARQARIDIIGRTGAPEGNAGFEIGTDGSTITIGAGRYYVDGIRVDLPAGVAFEDQPHAPTLPSSDGLYLAVLHVWERPIDAISAPHIREVALGGPDTATRTQLVAQVELLAVTTEVADPDCSTAFSEWDRLLEGSTTQMRVRLSEGTSEDPCSIPEEAGFRGLENQLYRIEVHDGNFDPTVAGAADPAATPTFKWSRDNGAVVAAWTAHTSTLELTIDRLGPGGTSGFAPGQWVEISDDASELARSPGLLAVIDEVGETTITLLDPDGTLAASLAGTFDASAHPRVRRWDSAGARALEVTAGELGSGDVTADGWIRLEGGIEVQFDAGAARPGDFWLLPARTAALPGTENRQLDWPLDTATGDFAARRPDGLAHHYARLALLRRSGGVWGDPLDCRPQFPPLTDLPEPIVGTGCGEIVVDPGADVAEALIEAGIARRSTENELVPDSEDVLRLCFRPGEHTIGNLAFAGWRMLALGGIGSGGAMLRGRVRVLCSVQVALRDLQLEDLGADGGRIPAPDDTVLGRQFRWRTRVVEVRACQDVAIERVRVSYRDPRWRLKDGQAIHVANARDLRVRDCVVRVPRGQNGIRAQDVQRVSIEHNRIEQDWSLRIDLSDFSDLERRELASWIGRLLVALGGVGNRAVPFLAVTQGARPTGQDRAAFRYGFGPARERYWNGEVTTLLFAPASNPTNTVLPAMARRFAESLHQGLELSALLPPDTSSSPDDLVQVRLRIEREFQTRRAAIGGRILSGELSSGVVGALRERLIGPNGAWLAGLGGTGVRCAVSATSNNPETAVRVAGNWIEDFAVGVAATCRQQSVGQGRIQRLDVCDNVLRLRSPLLPVQRGGVIVGGARRLRVDANDIDVLEGSSMQRPRGFFVGVDGIRVRGAQGAWLGVRDNHIRGCAVGIRRTGGTSVDPQEAPETVRARADNAFVACDQAVVWFSS